MDDSTGGIEVREVAPVLWDDFERLFESRGGPKNCWCMLGRKEDETERAPHGRDAVKAAMRRKIMGGVRVGLLAYSDGEPVAWCSVAPRETFTRLGAPLGENEDGASVWSLTCFYVRSAFRRRGLMELLIEEAVRHARGSGASVLEAYPTYPGSPSYLFGGYTPVFAAHGFEEVGRLGIRRHIMRRDL